EINGKKVDSPMALFDLMQNLKWEDTPKIVAVRGGKKVSVQLKFEKPPAAAEGDQTAKANDSGDVKGLIAALKTALETKDGSLDLSVKVDTSKSDVVELTLRFKKPPADKAESKNEAQGDRPRRRGARNDQDNSPRTEGRRPRAERDPAPVDPHAGADAEAHSMERPTVRLGIMPTYGESEGEGFEIAGVVDGGPAARAGMKDDDRILKIGDKKVSNIYEYMEALRKYKPGDEVPVTVSRKGKDVKLKIKSASQERKEAA
ncbi:MAG TPA: PDZ domain-containing protein, partial [Phycisphaerae bacterium]|nr:PDZ domain-containing protein [Phycisphaerae bacterium]